MPYKCEKLSIPKEYDRRRKLSDEDRAKIQELYGKVSQRKLAKMFNVSRRLIQFIGDPNKKKRDLELRELRGGSKIYYQKEKHTKAIREHRQYKQELYLKGELSK